MISSFHSYNFDEIIYYGKKNHFIHFFYLSSGKYSQRKNKKRKSGGSTEESVANDVAAISNDKQDLEPIRSKLKKFKFFHATL